MRDEQETLDTIQRYGFREIKPEYKRDQFIYGVRYLLMINGVEDVWQFSQPAGYFGFSVWGLLSQRLYYRGSTIRSELPSLVEDLEYRLFIQAPSMYPLIEKKYSKAGMVDKSPTPVITLDEFLGDDGRRAYMGPGVMKAVEEAYPTDASIAENRRIAALNAEIDRLRAEKELSMLWEPVRTLESAAARTLDSSLAMEAARLRTNIQSQLDSGVPPGEILRVRNLSKSDVTYYPAPMAYPAPMTYGTTMTYGTYAQSSVYSASIRPAWPRPVGNYPPQKPKQESAPAVKRRIVLEDESF